MTMHTLSPDDLIALQGAVGPNGITGDAVGMVKYLGDWSGDHHGAALAVLVSRREKLIIDACCDKSFTIETLWAAMAGTKDIHSRPLLPWDAARHEPARRALTR